MGGDCSIKAVAFSPKDRILHYGLWVFVVKFRKGSIKLCSKRGIQWGKGNYQLQYFC